MGSQRFRGVVAAGRRDSAVIVVPFDPDEVWGAKANHPVSGTRPESDSGPGTEPWGGAGDRSGRGGGAVGGRGGLGRGAVLTGRGGEDLRARSGGDPVRWHLRRGARVGGTVLPAGRPSGPVHRQLGPAAARFWLPPGG